MEDGKMEERRNGGKEQWKMEEGMRGYGTEDKGDKGEWRRETKEAGMEDGKMEERRNGRWRQGRGRNGRMEAGHREKEVGYYLDEFYSRLKATFHRDNGFFM